MAGRSERRRARDRGQGAAEAGGPPLDWLNPPAPPPAPPTVQGRWRPAEEEPPEYHHQAPGSLFQPDRAGPEPEPGQFRVQESGMPGPEPGRRSRRAQREAERQAGQLEQDDRDRAAPPPPATGGFTAPGERPEPPPRRRRRTLALWLTLVSLLLLLWSATCFVDSGNDLIAGPAALAPLVTVVALPVLAVAIGSKHPVPIAISVVAVLIPWALVVGYAASGPGSTSVGSDNTVRVVEVDGAGGRASARDIVQLSRSYDADVVVVTGLTSQLAHELTVQGLGTVLASRWVSIPAGTGAGTGLWSRLNVSNLKPLSGLSAPSVQGTISFGSASVQITVAALAGRPLLPGADWRSDLGDLAALPKSGPQFIVGGLDATPWQPAFRKLTKAGWHDAADVVGQGLRPTWPAWSPLPVAPLDHVLVRGGLGVSGTTTRKVAGTDHRALVATLILHPAPTAGD